MKKKIMSLLMAMVMVLGMGIVSQAYETRYFEGEGSIDRQYAFGSNVGVQTAVDSTLQISGNQYRLQFTGEDDGKYYDIIFKDIDSEYSNSEYTYLLLTGISIDGDVQNIPSDYFFDVKEMEHSVLFGGKISTGEIYISIFIDFSEVYETEPSIHEISTPFTGTAVSDREEYTLALAGYFKKELMDGTHELTLEEIKEQMISIVAYNKANGAKRVMRENTIEEMSVTVANGVVTEYIIRGRVQTDGGKLDRYTAVIEQ